MPMSRRTRVEHNKPIFKAQKIINGVRFRPNNSLIVANLAPITVTIQTDQIGVFSTVHNFVKKFVWDPIQSTYYSKSRAARHLRLNKFGNNKNLKKVVHGILTSTVCEKTQKFSHVIV